MRKQARLTGEGEAANSRSMGEEQGQIFPQLPSPDLDLLLDLDF
jgi:hypothetical protein